MNDAGTGPPVVEPVLEVEDVEEVDEEELVDDIEDVDEEEPVDDEEELVLVLDEAALDCVLEVGVDVVVVEDEVFVERAA